MKKMFVIVILLAFLLQPAWSASAVTIDQVGGDVSLSPVESREETALPEGCYRILFDETHGWASDPYGDYIIEDIFSQLAEYLRSYGHIVDVLQDPTPFDYDSIHHYDVLVLMTPQLYYSDEERAAIGEFVNEGGRLVTIGENKGFGAVANDILNKVHGYLNDGITHSSSDIHDATNNEGIAYWPILREFPPDPLNTGVSSIVEYLASGLELVEPAYPIALGDKDTYLMQAPAMEPTSSSGANLPGFQEEGISAFPERIILQPAGESDPQARQAPKQIGISSPIFKPLGYLVTLSEGFETGMVPPPAWSQKITNTNSPDYTWGLLTAGAPYAGSYSADVEYDPSLATQNEWLISPPMVATQGLLSFWSYGSLYWCRDDFNNCDLNIWIVKGDMIGDSDDIYVGTADGDWAGTFIWSQSTFDLTPYLTGDKLRIGFQYYGSDGAQIALDEIYLSGSVIAQAAAPVGAGQVFAIGDANLWDNMDWDTDGTISLYERDNERLALNVFAYGSQCSQCWTALLKDQNPWGYGGPLMLNSAGLAETEQQGLFDDAGNLINSNKQDVKEQTSKLPLAFGDVIHSIPSPNAFVGLEWIDGYLWAGYGQTLVKLDPVDGSVLQTIPTPGVYQCGLVWDGSAFWVSDCTNDVLVKLDTNGVVLRSFPSPGTGPVGVAWDGSTLWVSDFVTDEIYRLDPFLGNVLRTLPAPDTRVAGMEWDGNFLWTNGRDSGSTYMLSPIDGDVYDAFATPPSFGLNNGSGLAFDGQYLWLANYESATIYQIDIEHTPPMMEPNEEILTAYGRAYAVYGTDWLGKIDLTPFCRVIVASQQPYNFYQKLSDTRAWLQDWIFYGGMLEFHGATIDFDDWSGLKMPGGFSMQWAPVNDVTPVALSHPVLNHPFLIPPASLDNWNWSTHGYLIDLPAKSIEVIQHEPSGHPATADFPYGQGCVIATVQTLEWAWAHGTSPMLENYIMYDGCWRYTSLLPIIQRK